MTTIQTRCALDPEVIDDCLLPFFGMIQKRFEARFQQENHLTAWRRDYVYIGTLVVDW